MARRLARDADHVHVVLDRLARRLLRRLEQRPDVDVEAEVGEGRGDHLEAAVVAVLAELHHQHARAPAVRLGEGLDLAAHGVELVVAVVGAAVDARHRADLRAVARVDLLERVRDLADAWRARAPPRWRPRAGCPRPSARARASRARQRATAAPSRRARIASSRRICASRTAPLSMSRTSSGVSSAGRYLFTPTIDVLARVDARLAPRGGLLDAQLRHAGDDRPGHAAERLDLVDQARSRPGRRSR